MRAVWRALARDLLKPEHAPIAGAPHADHAGRPRPWGIAVPPTAATPAASSAAPAPHPTALAAVAAVAAGGLAGASATAFQAVLQRTRSADAGATPAPGGPPERAVGAPVAQAEPPGLVAAVAQPPRGGQQPAGAGAAVLVATLQSAAKGATAGAGRKPGHAGATGDEGTATGSASAVPPALAQVATPVVLPLPAPGAGAVGVHPPPAGAQPAPKPGVQAEAAEPVAIGGAAPAPAPIDRTPPVPAGLGDATDAPATPPGAPAAHAPAAAHGSAQPGRAEPAGGQTANGASAVSGAALPTPPGTAAAPTLALATLAAGTAAQAAPAASGGLANPVVSQLGPVLVGIGTAGGAHSVTVQLAPEELGRLQISVSRGTDGTAAVTVTAERATTLSLVQGDAAQLHAALDQAGIAAHGRTLHFQLADRVLDPPSASPPGAPGARAASAADLPTAIREPQASNGAGAQGNSGGSSGPGVNLGGSPDGGARSGQGQPQPQTGSPHGLALSGGGGFVQPFTPGVHVIGAGALRAIDITA